jgi:dTMP kinase
MSGSGILIAVEGIDGSGKTTQVELLRQALLSAGELPVVSKEPTRGYWGNIIRRSATTGRLAVDEELKAFINDRTEHVEQIIGPALDQGRIVILDRYFYSSVAYQGSRGASPEAVESTMKSRFPLPDAVYLLDVDPVLSVHRIAHSRGEEPNHFEERANLAKARAIFNGMSDAEIYRIDGSMSIEAVRQKILDHFVYGPLKSKRCSKAYGCDDPAHCSFRLTNSCEWVRLSGALSNALTQPA